MNSEKKVVHSSNLALRFYKADGWTREILEKYLLRGKLTDTEHSHHCDTPAMAYFILQPGGYLDMAKLHENEVCRVVRTYNDKPRQSDVQYMEGFNW